MVSSRVQLALHAEFDSDCPSDRMWYERKKKEIKEEKKHLATLHKEIDQPDALAAQVPFLAMQRRINTCWQVPECTRTRSAAWDSYAYTTNYRITKRRRHSSTRTQPIYRTISSLPRERLERIWTMEAEQPQTVKQAAEDLDRILDLDMHEADPYYMRMISYCTTRWGPALLREKSPREKSSRHASPLKIWNLPKIYRLGGVCALFSRV